MVLFYKVNLSPYLGAILATAIGYIFALLLSLKKLQKDHGLRYLETIKIVKKILLPTLLMIAAVEVCKQILPIHYESRTSCSIYIAINSIVGVFVYLFITYKKGILTKVLGESMLNRIIKKLTFGKVSLN